MAVTFFWRMEGTTLDATHDFTAGDNTASVVSAAALDAAAARVGTLGGLFGQSDRFEFNPSGIVTAGEGSVAGWFRFPSSWPTNNQGHLFYCRGAASANRIEVLSAGTSGNLKILHSNATNGTIELATAALSLAADTGYCFVARWNSSINYRSIAVYDDNADLIDEVVDAGTDFSSFVPAELGSTSGLRYGDTSGNPGIVIHEDNVFVADTYDELLQNNLLITSYTEYSAVADGIALLPILSQRANTLLRL